MSRDPEGLWNLLEIVRDLFKMKDRNSCEILQIFTEECLNFHQLALWWFTSETEDGNEMVHPSANLSNSEFPKHTGARLLNESVSLWKVALMSPAFTESDKKSIKAKLEQWQKAVIDKASKGC